uniref:semaphorin-4A-like n=1 Tax=Monopterus albus TaxID=43700 RepID=UPI0009B48EB6|nr:semaphorin-4A-like [Monopterus albus]
MGTDQWSLLQGRQSYLGTCGLENATDSELAEVKKSFLTSNGVKPVENSPIVVSSGKQYSRIAVMRTKAANGTAYTILFLLTESGFLHKVVLFDQGPQIIEEIQVFTQPQLIKSIILSSSKGVLYVGTSEGVTAVPTANCAFYRTCSQCVLARDPLCGWSLTRRTCIRVDSSSDAVAQDLENGNVEERCQSQPRMNPDTVEVSVALNRAVRLQCVKPSNLATLTWTSSQIRSRPENFFIRSSDGSLSFLASDATFGSYHCEAEEGGYKEVVASYNVRSIASPRSMNPSPNIPSQNDESYEDIRTVSPLPLPGEPECLPKEEDGDDDKGKTDTKEQSEQETSLQHGRLDTTPTCKSGAQSMKEPFDEACKEKSYYSELVVVVTLLVLTYICILTLGGLHVWRQRRSGLKVSPLVSPEEGSQMSKSGGRVPSLSTAEYTAPELKVVE